MKKLQLVSSNEILEKDDLYDLQFSFSCCSIPFQYELTSEEYQWAKFLEGKYAIAHYVLSNLDHNRILTFHDSQFLMQALIDDGIPHKAVMLSDDTALQRLFYWLSEGN